MARYLKKYETQLISWDETNLKNVPIRSKKKLSKYAAEDNINETTLTKR